MDKNQNEALILISAELIVGIEGLSEIVKELSKNFLHVTASSLYKKYHSRRKEDLNAEISLVIRATTELDLFELYSATSKVESLTTRGKRFLISILSFNSEVKMSPRSPIPNPILHTDRLVLKCATEVFGSYIHPVLHKSLDQLFSAMDPLDYSEFFAQPKAIEK